MIQITKHTKLVLNFSTTLNFRHFFMVILFSLSMIINTYIYNSWSCLINIKTLHSGFLWTSVSVEICRQVSFCLPLMMSFSRYEPRNNETQTAWRNARRVRIVHNGVFKYPSFLYTGTSSFSLYRIAAHNLSATS